MMFREVSNHIRKERGVALTSNTYPLIGSKLVAVQFRIQFTELVLRQPILHPKGIAVVPTYEPVRTGAIGNKRPYNPDTQMSNPIDG